MRSVCLSKSMRPTLWMQVSMGERRRVSQKSLCYPSSLTIKKGKRGEERGVTVVIRKKDEEMLEQEEKDKGEKEPLRLKSVVVSNSGKRGVRESRKGWNPGMTAT